MFWGFNCAIQLTELPERKCHSPMRMRVHRGWAGAMGSQLCLWQEAQTVLLLQVRSRIHSTMLLSVTAQLGTMLQWTKHKSLRVSILPKSPEISVSWSASSVTMRVTGHTGTCLDSVVSEPCCWSQSGANFGAKCLAFQTLAFFLGGTGSNRLPQQELLKTDCTKLNGDSVHATWNVTP